MRVALLLVSLVAMSFVTQLWPPFGAVCLALAVLLTVLFFGRWRRSPKDLHLEIAAPLVLLLALLGVDAYRKQPFDVPTLAVLGAMLVGVGVFAPYIAEYRRMSDAADLSEDDLAPFRYTGGLPTMSVAKLLSGGGESVAFVVTPQGHLVTNAHCVQGAPNLKCVLANGELFEARAIVVRPEWDLALIKIEAPYRLPAASLGYSEDLRLGTPLWVIGYEPWSMLRTSYLFRPGMRSVFAPMEGPVVVAGTLAAVTEPWSDEFAVLCVAANDVLRPGYSGSPVCTRRGAVVGVHSGGYGRFEVGQSVPSELVRRMMKEAGVRPRRNRLFWQLPLRLDEAGLDRYWLGAAYRFYELFRAQIDDVEDLKDPGQLSYWRDSTDQYLERLPDCPPALLCDAWVSLAEGDRERARSQAATALLEGHEPGACFFLSMHRESDAEGEQNVDLARSELVSIEGLEGYIVAHYRAFVYRLLITDLLRLKRHEECIAACEQAMPDLSVAKRTYFARVAWAKALLALGRYAEAVEMFDHAIDAGHAEDETDHDWAGLVEALLGEGSEPNLRRAVDMGLWHLTRSRMKRRALELSAEAAERLGYDHLAQTLRELAAASAKPEEIPDEATEAVGAVDESVEHVAWRLPRYH